MSGQAQHIRAAMISSSLEPNIVQNKDLVRRCLALLKAASRLTIDWRDVEKRRPDEYQARVDTFNEQVSSMRHFMEASVGL